MGLYLEGLIIGEIFCVYDVGGLFSRRAYLRKFTVFTRNLEMISPRSSVRVRFCIKKYTILALTREARVNGKHGVNRCPSVKSNNISIKAQQTDLRYKNIALS